MKNLIIQLSVLDNDKAERLREREDNMFATTEITGDKVRKGDMFVNATRDVVAFDVVLGTRKDGDNRKVVTDTLVFDGNGLVSFGDVGLTTFANDDIVNVVRA